MARTQAKQFACSSPPKKQKAPKGANVFTGGHKAKSNKSVCAFVGVYEEVGDGSMTRVFSYKVDLIKENHPGDDSL